MLLNYSESVGWQMGTEFGQKTRRCWHQRTESKPNQGHVLISQKGLRTILMVLPDWRHAPCCWGTAPRPRASPAYISGASASSSGPPFTTSLETSAEGSPVSFLLLPLSSCLLTTSSEAHQENYWNARWLLTHCSLKKEASLMLLVCWPRFLARSWGPLFNRREDRADFFFLMHFQAFRENCFSRGERTIISRNKEVLQEQVQTYPAVPWLSIFFYLCQWK